MTPPQETLCSLCRGGKKIGSGVERAALQMQRWERQLLPFALLDDEEEWQMKLEGQPPQGPALQELWFPLHVDMNMIPPSRGVLPGTPAHLEAISEHDLLPLALSDAPIDDDGVVVGCPICRNLNLHRSGVTCDICANLRALEVRIRRAFKDVQATAPVPLLAVTSVGAGSSGEERATRHAAALQEFQDAIDFWTAYQVVAEDAGIPTVRSVSQGSIG